MNKKIITGIAIVLLGVGVAVSVHANPFFFLPTAQTATATTTPAFVTSAGATATTTFDSYAAGQPNVTETATLFTQMAASSTSSVLTMKLQYSQDGIDYYDDQINFSTSTIPADISAVNSFKWTAASTATTSKAITIKTPTRFVRVVTSVAGANAAIWNQFVPIRQRTQ